MKRLITVAAPAVALVAPGGQPHAEATDHAQRYYLSLGDSLADSAQLAGDLTHNAVLDATYTAAGVPVADVAGAFHNGEQPLSAHLVCAWTWFCTHGNVHPNTTGYGVIAQAFLEQIQP